MAALRADLIVFVHALYVGYVALLPIFVLVGACLGWRWIRNPWLRYIHLIMIGIVVCESVVGYECPLTTWEGNLRLEAGQPIQGESFIGRHLHDLVFVELRPQQLAAAYVAFGLAVVALHFAVPPRRFRKSKDSKPDRADHRESECKTKSDPKSLLFHAGTFADDDSLEQLVKEA